MYRTIVSQLEGEKHLRVSDWVYVSHDGVRITGFIVEISEAVVKIRITDPKNRGNVLMVKKAILKKRNTPFTLRTFDLSLIWPLN